ncbi:hypothetical protein [Spirillospora sp. NBC_01491]|uniref:hypothetical protein n=1 Tax=Spirillospora sp. NBC_01491 TaxID=2976007 RepID=UPI002E331379|nr:hypothetical protein [Spirillospora sp. NBC_01491]
MSNPLEPPELFAWDAEQTGGVTDDCGRAIGHVHRALADAPAGASGMVRQVRLGGASGVRYITLGVVGLARRDEASGAVEWTDGTR